MEKFILTENICGGFKLQTEKNYNAYISNDREVWRFENYNGFKTVNDVISYVEKYFKINRENIIIKN